jgi:TPR repeat protein
MYYNGFGVTADVGEAVRWLRKAAAQGDVESAKFLAKMSPAELEQSATTKPN